VRNGRQKSDEICKQAHNDYLNTVANEDDDDDNNEVSGFRNLQPPLYTVVAFRSQWRSLAQEALCPDLLHCRGHHPKGGIKIGIVQTACDIVSLMSMRPKARSIVESGDVATAAAVEDNVATSLGLKPGDSPLLLVQCHFLCAFGECFFKPNFEMAMQSDPKFGTDSHGHLSRLLV
jgi:hypothetical protein